MPQASAAPARTAVPGLRPTTRPASASMHSAGIGIRQSSATDTLITAYAWVNSLEVLTADHDLEHISAALGGELRVTYIASSH